MMGFDSRFTTSRSLDSGGGAVAAAVFSCALIERPVSTAVAPITPLRMRNVRRSTPLGTSVRAISNRGRLAWAYSYPRLWFSIVCDDRKRRGEPLELRGTPDGEPGA